MFWIHFLIVVITKRRMRCLRRFYGARMSASLRRGCSDVTMDGCLRGNSRFFSTKSRSTWIWESTQTWSRITNILGIQHCREGLMTSMLFFMDSKLRATIFKVIYFSSMGPHEFKSTIIVGSSTQHCDWEPHYRAIVRKSPSLNQKFPIGIGHPTTFAALNFNFWGGRAP